MLRRLARPAAFVLGAALLAGLTPPADAQYIYLDSNGDGVHTEADVLAASGVTTVEIWLITDRNRDGSAAGCAVDSGAAMTVNSYEVILRAVGGTVSWANFTNLVPTATTSFGYRSDSVELYAGFGGGEILPPGVYHLARLDVTPLTGAPSLIFGRSSRLYPPGYTSFGCACVGVDQDNTLKLGQEWLDAVGLLAPNASHTPVLDPVADQEMQEGESRSIAIGAGDADGSMMTLTVAPPLAFVHYSETRNDPGRIEGSLSLNPGFADSGSYALAIRADDGAFVVETGFRLSVLNRVPPPPGNDPPALSFLPDLGVPPGGVRDLALSASDPDGDLLSLDWTEHPQFASLVIQSALPGRIDGVLHLAPTTSDVGIWGLGFVVSDGWHAVAWNIHVTVGPNHPPTVTHLDPYLLLEGGYRGDYVQASDADGDRVELSALGAPDFVHLSGENRFQGFAEKSIEFIPQVGDAGDYRFQVVATDGYTQVALPVEVTVLPSGSLPVAWTPSLGGMCLEIGSTRYLGVTANDPSGNPLSIEMVGAPSWVSMDSEGPGAALLTIAPPVTEVQGIRYLALRATNAASDFGAALLTMDLKPYPFCQVICSICASTGGGSGGVPPVAAAGGPYKGFVGDPVRFDGRWSSEGSTQPSYSWKFGDGSTKWGALVEHRYATSGRYDAILAVSNRTGTSRDTAEVVVRDPIPARVFVWPHTRVIPLTDSRAAVELHVELLEPGYEARSLELAASCLRADGLGEVDSIGATPGHQPSIGDVDENGTPDAGIRFSVSELRRLLSSIQGKGDASVRFETRAGDGAPVRGTVALTVLGTPTTGIQIGPNPFNPSGSIAFDVETAGLVRVRQFDVTGRLVRTFLDEAAGRPGPRIVTIDGRDDLGRQLASGVYFFKIERGARVDRARVIILK